MQLYLKNLQVKFLCQDRRVKVKVAGSKKRQTDRPPRNPHFLHSPDGDTNITRVQHAYVQYVSWQSLAKYCGATLLSDLQTSNVILIVSTLLCWKLTKNWSNVVTAASAEEQSCYGILQ